MRSFSNKLDQGNPPRGEKGGYQNKQKHKRAEAALRNLIQISNEEENSCDRKNSFQDLIQLRYYQSSSRWSNESESEKKGYQKHDFKSSHSLNKSLVKPKVDCYMKDKPNENINKKKPKYMKYSNLIHNRSKDLKQDNTNQESQQTFTSKLVFVAKLKETSNNKSNNYYKNFQAKRITHKIASGTIVQNSNLFQFTPKSIPAVVHTTQQTVQVTQIGNNNTENSVNNILNMNNSNNNSNNNNDINTSKIYYQSENLKRKKLLSKNSMRIFRNTQKQKQKIELNNNNDNDNYNYNNNYYTPQKNIINTTTPTPTSTSNKKEIGDFFKTVNFIKNQQQQSSLQQQQQIDNNNNNYNNNNNNNQEQKLGLLKSKKYYDVRVKNSNSSINNRNNNNSKIINIINLDLEIFPSQKSMMMMSNDIKKIPKNNKLQQQ